MSANRAGPLGLYSNIVRSSHKLGVGVTNVHAVQRPAAKALEYGPLGQPIVNNSLHGSNIVEPAPCFLVSSGSSRKSCGYQGVPGPRAQGARRAHTGSM